jgi:hypothetical protein
VLPVLATPAAAQPPRLLDQLRQLALNRFGRREPAERYVCWVRRFILFHGMHHPRELGLGEVARFLKQLAQSEKDALRSLEQAREALGFLYEELLNVSLGDLPFPEPPRLLDRLLRALRLHHYSPRTETCYMEWAVRFVRFQGLRHPNTMGAAEIEMFLTNLAVNVHMSASTGSCVWSSVSSRGVHRCGPTPFFVCTAAEPRSILTIGSSEPRGGSGLHSVSPIG